MIKRMHLIFIILLVMFPAITGANDDVSKYRLDRGHLRPNQGMGGGAQFTLLTHIAAGYDVLKFSRGAGDATFGGLTYGGGIEPHISWGSIGLGTNISFLAANMKNGANTATRKETLSSRDFQLTMRLQAGILLLGLGPVVRQLTLTSVNTSQTSEIKYACFGIRTEAGVRFVLGGILTIAPLLQYELLWVNSNNGTGATRANSYVPILNIGVSW